MKKCNLQQFSKIPMSRVNGYDLPAKMSRVNGCDLPAKMSRVNGCDLPAKMSRVNGCDLPAKMSRVNGCDLPAKMSRVNGCDLPAKMSRVNGYDLPAKMSRVNGCDLPAISDKLLEHGPQAVGGTHILMPPPWRTSSYAWKLSRNWKYRLSHSKYLNVGLKLFHKISMRHNLTFLVHVHH